MNGGERHGQKLGVAHIVKADQPDLLRHSHPHADQSAHQVCRGQIIAADHAVRLHLFHQLAEKLRIFYIAVERSGRKLRPALA